MNFNKKITVIFSGLILLVSFLADHACASLTSLGGQPGYFLQMPVSSRTTALGNAGTALINDASAAWFNPAGLAFSEAPEILAFHAFMPGGISWQYLGIQTGKQRMVAGLSIAELTLNKIQEYDDWGNGLGDFNYGIALVTVSSGLRLAKWLGVGVACTGFRQDFYHKISYGYAIDVGLQVLATKWVALGFDVSNIAGKGLSELFQNRHYPLQIRSGIAIFPIQGIAFTTDLVKTSSRTTPNAGIELSPIAQSALRVGVTEKNLTWGVGFQMNGLVIDYAVLDVDNHILQNLSIRLKF